VDTVYEALTTLRGLAGWWAPVTGSGAEGGELRFTFRSDEAKVLRLDTLAACAVGSRRADFIQSPLAAISSLPSPTHAVAPIHKVPGRELRVAFIADPEVHVVGLSQGLQQAIEQAGYAASNEQ
jgi:hypothetical protein